MDIEKILKGWARAKSQDEESLFVLSAKSTDLEFCLVIWTKPKVEQESTEDAEEENEEDQEASSCYPGSENYKPPWEEGIKSAGPKNYIEEAEDEASEENPDKVDNETIFMDKLLAQDHFRIKRAVDPRPTRE